MPHAALAHGNRDFETRLPKGLRGASRESQRLVKSVHDYP
jgi:hypothetical protein